MAGESKAGGRGAGCIQMPFAIIVNIVKRIILAFTQKKKTDEFKEQKSFYSVKKIIVYSVLI